MRHRSDNLNSSKSFLSEKTEDSFTQTKVMSTPISDDDYLVFDDKAENGPATQNINEGKGGNYEGEHPPTQIKTSHYLRMFLILLHRFI